MKKAIFVAFMNQSMPIPRKSSAARSYFIAGKLLHLITLIEIVGILLILPYLFAWDTDGQWLLTGLKYYAMVFLLSLPFFSQLDARSRYQNYKQIKDQIFLYGYDERIFRPVLKSRCQRDAAWLSAKELGFGHTCSSFFYHHGYRWYHILPDFVFKKPHFLLTVYFWRTTFFSPTYIPKVNYQDLHILEKNIKPASDAVIPIN
jgi:hypothetical protein